MKQKTTQILDAYWNELRAGRLAPKRLEIEPSRIGSILAETFMLERAGASLYRYRLAGTRLCEIFGSELRGTNLLDGWSGSDRAALAAFYAGAEAGQLWVTRSGFKDRARAAMAEIRNAADWGLSASEFALPVLEGSALSDEDLAAAEVKLSLAVLKYARHARGGRIAEPSTQLSSYIDRKPTLKEPRTVLEEIARAPEPDAYLRELHPRHPQFVKLREALVALRRQAAPAKAFVEAIGPGLRKISKTVNAEPKVNGSIFRINRDVRFSKDKSPYKTHVAAHFRHRATQNDVHAP